MARIGYTTCGTCGNSEATVSETATGTLSINCHKCEMSSYAKRGSKAARMIRANLRPDEDTAEPSNPPAADPAPAAKAETGFRIGSL